MRLVGIDRLMRGRDDSVRVEPVPRRHRRQAIQFIAGGSACDPTAKLRAELLNASLRESDSLGTWIWAAWQGRRMLAASAVTARPGRTGMLFHCPADAPGVDTEQMSGTVRAACAAGLERGLNFIQSLEDLDMPSDVAVLQTAGFARLAELIYMDRPLPMPAAESAAGVTWQTARQMTDAELGRIIQTTYIQSLDCPAISGLRSIADILASHRSGGVYDPDNWLIPHVESQPAGCIFINDFGIIADVVYMGVSHEFRGRGLGRLMLQQAASGATLANDA